MARDHAAVGAARRTVTAVSDAGLSQAPTFISEMLDEYGVVTRRALQRYLPAGGTRPYLDDLMADYPSRGGKMMRSSLCLATARAFGARLEDAIGTAMSIELLHNAILIHDDIEDGSDERRGRPALHQLHGMPLALNAGDSLSLLSLRPLKDNVERLGARIALRLLEETESMAWESAEGQALELGWRRDNRLDVTDADYLAMILKKTCWLATIHPSRTGALIGTRGRADLEPFFRFGFFFGAAFQIQDDVLNLAGDARYGKELNGDLWEGKRTLMLVHAYRHCSIEQRAEFARALALPREQRTQAQVDWLRARIEAAKSIEYALAIARGLAGAALREFEEIYADRPDSRDKAFIRGLVTWTLERAT
jgi:geranylgeranyl diphosphate synthase type II